jgi:AsmA protein
VRYVDRTKEPAVETIVEPLDVRVFDLSLTDVMRVEIDGEAAGATPTTASVRGTVGPVGDPPFAADVPIEQHVAIHGPALDVADLVVTGRVRRGEDGAPIAGLRIAAPMLRARGVDLTTIDLVASEREGVATLERMAFGVFGGTVQGNGRVDHSGATPTFAAEAHVRGVDVSRALAARESDLAARFEGHLDADCSVSGNAGDDAVVRRTLRALGHAAVRNGRLLGVNVADGVLSGVTGVAGLVTLVPARVRGRYPEIFASDDTRFEELSADVSIADERVQLESLVVSAPDYAVRGHGTVTFTQRVDVTATLVASAPLTADVVGALKESQVLTDADGRLAIPFRLTGVLPKVRPQPDAEFVARVLRKALAGEGLERLLGGKRDRKRHDGKGRQDTNDAIKRGLDKLFR